MPCEHVEPIASGPFLRCSWYDEGGGVLSCRTDTWEEFGLNQIVVKPGWADKKSKQPDLFLSSVEESVAWVLRTLPRPMLLPLHEFFPKGEKVL